jgi:hypothetical protein
VTREEALDAIAQSGPLLEAIERILREAQRVLDITDEDLKKPNLKVINIEDARQGNPNDWKWRLDD